MKADTDRSSSRASASIPSLMSGSSLIVSGGDFLGFGFVISPEYAHLRATATLAVYVFVRHCMRFAYIVEASMATISSEAEVQSSRTDARMLELIARLRRQAAFWFKNVGDAAAARTAEVEIKCIANEIYASPSRSLLDLVARAELAAFAASYRQTGEMVELTSDDIFESASAQLIVTLCRLSPRTDSPSCLDIAASLAAEGRGAIAASGGNL